MPVEAVRWNFLGLPETNLIQRGRDCKDHPAVRGTSYNEIYRLLGTTGCSEKEPLWSWSALGIIKSKVGKIIVHPGDWIITTPTGEFLVMDNLTFDSLYETNQAR